jgi:hypothetical protein
MPLELPLPPLLLPVPLLLPLLVAPPLDPELVPPLLLLLAPPELEPVVPPPPSFWFPAGPASSKVKSGVFEPEHANSPPRTTESASSARW